MTLKLATDTVVKRISLESQIKFLLAFVLKKLLLCNLLIVISFSIVLFAFVVRCVLRFRFAEKTCVASGGQSTKPLYLLTNNAVGVPVFDTTQNELVNKVG